MNQLLKPKASFALCGLLLASVAQSQVGRQLDTIIDPIAIQTVESVGLDFGVSPVVGIFWDERCAEVEYTFNSNAGANVGSPLEISPAQLADVVQDGLDRWNDIPSAYIKMDVTRIADLGSLSLIHI